MISFDEFDLSLIEINRLKKANARKEIKKYIAEHGVEPEDITPFLTYTQEQYDEYKKILYSRTVVNPIKDSEIPLLPPKPAETENTPEQNETLDNIADAVVNGSSSYTAGEDEIINNVVIPEDAPKSFTINGPVQDGASISNEGTKGVTVNNTSEDPIDITVSNTSSSATFTLKGDAGYNDIYAESNKITTFAPTIQKH